MVHVPEIKSISTIWSPGTESIQVLGLSDDNLVYAWVYEENGWTPFSPND